MSRNGPFASVKPTEMAHFVPHMLRNETVEYLEGWPSLTATSPAGHRAFWWATRTRMSAEDVVALGVRELRKQPGVGTKTADAILVAAQEWLKPPGEEGEA